MAVHSVRGAERAFTTMITNLRTTPNPTCSRNARARPAPPLLPARRARRCCPDPPINEVDIGRSVLFWNACTFRCSGVSVSADAVDIRPAGRPG